MQLSESKLQKIVKDFLKSKGVYVINAPGGHPGVPSGCPDLVGLYSGGFVALEIKVDEKSRFQPLQKETLTMLNDYQYARVVHNNNWSDIKEELETFL